MSETVKSPEAPEPNRRLRLTRVAAVLLLASPLLVALPRVRAELVVQILENSAEDGGTAKRCRTRLIALGPAAVPALIRLVRREHRPNDAVMGRGERALVSLALRSPEVHEAICDAVEGGLDAGASVRILTQHLGSAELPDFSAEARRRAAGVLRERFRRCPPGDPAEALLLRGLIELKPGIAGLQPRLPEALASRTVAVRTIPSSGFLESRARLDTILASLGRSLGRDFEIEEDFYRRSGLRPGLELELFRARDAGELLRSIAAPLPGSTLITGVDHPWLSESEVREGLPLCYEQRGDRLRIISLRTAIERLRASLNPEARDG